jgi:cold shock CspA family protein
VGVVQATVLSFDESTRAGSVLLDDGAELTFPGSALDGSGLRLLRRGQRVRLLTEPTDTAPRVVSVRLPSPG